MTKSNQVVSVPAPSARPAEASRVLPAIPGWKLLERLPGGPLSDVYLARPDRVGESSANYVLKLPAAGREHDEQALQAIAREALAGRKLSHPHVAPVLAADLKHDPPFLVLPRLEGCTLAELLRRGSLPAVPVALWFARQVAEGLDGLSRSGWRHGDIKPQNLFIAPSGHLTLIDLGFATRLDEPNPTDRPILGTPIYMAPETITSRLAGDIRSDLYSLGCVLFELLSGHPPFDAKDAPRLAAQHREDLPADLRSLIPHLPPHVARLVRNLLSKDPLRRPQTPAEVADRLAALEIETFADRIVA